jgi:hypothetical protein
MKKLHLREAFNKQTFENIIAESAQGRPDIEESAREIFEAMQEVEQAAVDGNDIITEATKLGSGEITKLFKAASNASKGLDPGTKEPGMMSKLGGKVKGAVAGKLGQMGQKLAKTKIGGLTGKAKQAISKLNDVVTKAAQKLQDTTPVQQADTKIDQLLSQWKQKAGGDDAKVVKLAAQLGELGKKYPKRAAFAIAALSGLASFAGSPVAGMAVGTALRTALGLAKGERASTAFGKAVKVAAVGSIIGSGVSSLADSLSDFSGSAIDTIRNVVKPLKDYVSIDREININGQQFNFSGIAPKAVYDHIDSLGKKASDLFTSDDAGPAWIKAEAKFLSAMDNVLNSDNLQQKYAQALLDQGVEVDKRAIMKATGSKISQMIGAISAGAGGGAGGAAAEGKPKNESLTLADGELFRLIEADAQAEQKGMDFDALRDAWIKVGKPQTAKELIAMFKQLGLNTDQIRKSFDVIGMDLGAGKAGGAELSAQQVQSLQNMITASSKEQLTQLFQQIKAI